MEGVLWISAVWALEAVRYNFIHVGTYRINGMLQCRLNVKENGRRCFLNTEYSAV